MRDTDRVITESFSEDMGTVVMDDVPWIRPGHPSPRPWHGRRAPVLQYATPERREIHERVICEALVRLNPHNRRR